VTSRFLNAGIFDIEAGMATKGIYFFYPISKWIQGSTRGEASYRKSGQIYLSFVALTFDTKKGFT
jgi:hypothetical protein